MKRVICVKGKKKTQPNTKINVNVNFKIESRSCAAAAFEQVKDIFKVENEGRTFLHLNCNYEVAEAVITPL